MKVLAIACVAAWASAASADTIVVAGRDRALVAALRDALAPAQVSAVDDVAPTAIAELTTASRTVADREHARAAIWLASDGTATTLVAYDRNVDRVLVRPLAYAMPLSDAQAAVVARSARAMLRALRSEEPAPPAEPYEPPVVIAKPPPKPDVLATSAAIAVRFGAPGSAANGELAVGAIWRPHRLGIAADLTLSPAADVKTMTFDGSIGDRSLAVAARLPLRLSQRATLAANAGVALHAIRFAGVSPREQIIGWRFDPAIRAGGTATYAITDELDVGLVLAVDSLLLRQRYEVEGEEVLVMSQLQVAAGLLVTLGLW